MRVLLTRAAEDAARTRRTLEELGHTVLVSPVIEIEATGAAWPGDIVDAILATSSQAFRVMPPGWGPKPAARRLTPLWLVGKRTEEAARESGFHGAAIVARNAVDLALDLKKRAGHLRSVYLAGRDRKPDIETALTVTGCAVEIVELYRARPVEALHPRVMQALTVGSIDAAFHFSRRSAELFALLLDRANLAPPRSNLCLSKDVAMPLEAAGWSAAVAREPTELSLIAALAEAAAT